MAGGPYCVENDVRGSGNVTIADIQRPPSYFEVIGFFDPPPSYNDVLRVGSNSQQLEANQVPLKLVIKTIVVKRFFSSFLSISTTNSFLFLLLLKAYDNVAVTIDELPPPFAEGDYIKSGEKIVTCNGPETSAINSLSTTVSVIPTREGQDGSNHS